MASDAPPRYEPSVDGGRSSDAVEPQVRALLREHPTMPATVIAAADRLWTHSITVLKDRVRAIRPEYRGVDPVDRLVHEPGASTQCDLWFPAPRIAVGHGQVATLPVLVMTWAYSRFITARMIPSRQGGDILAGMWALVQRGRRGDQASCGGTGSPRSAARAPSTSDAAAFAGTLASRGRAGPPARPGVQGHGRAAQPATWRPRSCPGARSPPRRTSTPSSPTGSRWRTPARCAPWAGGPWTTSPRTCAAAIDAAARGAERRAAHPGAPGPGVLRADRRLRLLRRPGRDRTVRRRRGRPRAGPRHLPGPRRRRPRPLLGAGRHDHRSRARRTLPRSCAPRGRTSERAPGPGRRPPARRRSPGGAACAAGLRRAVRRRLRPPTGAEAEDGP